jgi:HSP20 family protein
VLTPADLFRLNPFSLFRRLTEELERPGGESAGRGGQATWSPAVEVQQREGNFIVRAELPGLNADDVTIDVTDDAITISGERREEQEVEREGMRVTERRYGRFLRSIPLPEGANTEDAKARFENGLLEITVPVQERRSERRQIAIDRSGSSGPGGSGGASGSQGSERAA